MNPILLYYDVLFIISIVLLLLLVLRWQVQLDVDMTVMFTLVPLIIVGYIKLATSATLDTAIYANQITYLGGCFLQLLIFLIVCNLCHVRLNGGIRFALFGIATIIYLFVLTIGSNPWFYKSVRLEKNDGISILVKEYGPVHSVFYAVLITYVILALAMVVYAYRYRPDVSMLNLNLITFTMSASVLLFFGGRFITKSVEFAPLTYIIAETGFLAVSYRLRLYNISGDIARNVLENGADGLVCLDMNRNLLVCNQTAKLMIPPLALAKADKPLDDAEPRFLKLNMSVDRFKAGIADREMILESEGSFYRLNVNYLKDNRKNSGYYILINDVTAERNYNKELTKAKNEAEAADAAKTQFLAQMSHEIRTPINAVLGMNEMIMRESRDPAILDYAQSIHTSGNNLLFLINSILDFSKIEDGKMEIINEEYDLVSLVMSLVNPNAMAAELKNLRFNVEVDGALPVKLRGDDVRISQVVLNLLSNAIKYTDQGEVTLCITAGGKKPDGRQVLHVEVRDTGMGIRREDMNRLFEEFARLDESKNHRKEGTGLGMAIIYNLLKLMDSEIHVESTYGEGSVFWFDLRQEIVDPTPIGDYKERARMADRRAKQEITLYAPEARILVVDDNSLNLKVTRGYLKVCGIVPDEASSGNEAIEMMRDHEYDVVLLDHMMPGMDGVETLNEIKRQGLAHDQTVIVALTANAIEGSRENYLKLGFDDYISKPMNLKELADKVEGYLRKDKQ